MHPGTERGVPGRDDDGDPCTATGSRGTTSTGTFDVTVTASNQPPVLQLSAAVTVDAVGPSGAPVSYAAATDDGTAT